MIYFELEGKKYYIKFYYTREVGSNMPIQTEARIFNNEGELMALGQAFLSPHDSPVREIGRKISLGRALQAWIPRDKREPIWKAYFERGK